MPQSQGDLSEEIEYEYDYDAAVHISFHSRGSRLELLKEIQQLSSVETLGKQQVI